MKLLSMIIWVFIIMSLILSIKNNSSVSYEIGKMWKDVNVNFVEGFNCNMENVK